MTNFDFFFISIIMIGVFALGYTIGKKDGKQ